MRAEDAHIALPPPVWSPAPKRSSGKPTVGPVADAARERVCGVHHDKPCRAPEHPLPYWQYLERMNARYGGVEREPARREKDSVVVSDDAQRAAGTVGVGVLPKDAERGGYGLPRLTEVLAGKGAAKDRAATTLRAAPRERLVPVTSGTRVDVVV